LAFLGRNAKIISEIDEPIHIIMERVTSKTMDAFVEFISIDEAALAISRYESNRAGGRGSRLGERHVDLEVVGHDHLMHAIFPKAANVQWKGTIPEVFSSNDKYNSGFKGFVMQEELVMLVKHVECPQRVSVDLKHSLYLC
jgi:RNase P/RNase MRP subunit p29